MNGDANELIDKIAARYRQCGSYTDEGVLTNEADAISFRTCFERPYRFRFEWIGRDDEEQSTVLCDGKKTYVQFGGRPAKRVSTLPFLPVPAFDLAKAISMAHQRSKGSVETIASLLILNVGSRRFTELKPYVSLDDQRVGARDCYHVRADWRPMCSTELWIDREDLMVCKIASEFTQTPEEKAKIVAQLNKTDPHLADSMFMKRPETRSQLIVFHTCAFDTAIPDEVFKHRS